MSYVTYNGKYATIGGKYAILGGGAPSYPTDGLLARYDFDYNYNDSYGSYDIPETYSDDFVTPGIFRTTFVEGLNGKGCIKSSSTVGRALSPILSADLASLKKTYTLVFWMNMGGYTSTLMGWGDGNRLGLYFASGKASAFRFSTSSSYRTSQTPVAVNTGWHMFLHSFDGTNLRFNMDNGTYNYTKALTVNISPANAIYGIISGGTGAGLQYSYIYNRAITDDEIAILWNNGTGL